MTDEVDEWFKQAEFDITAGYTMAESTTSPYAVFFCHQAIEKALKGLYLKKFKEAPQKTHSLVTLAVRLTIPIPKTICATIQLLNTASVNVRYPPDLDELVKIYSYERVCDILKRSEEVLDWTLKQCRK